MSLTYTVPSAATATSLQTPPFGDGYVPLASPVFRSKERKAGSPAGGEPRPNGALSHTHSVFDFSSASTPSTLVSLASAPLIHASACALSGSAR